MYLVKQINLEIMLKNRHEVLSTLLFNVEITFVLCWENFKVFIIWHLFICFKISKRKKEINYLSIHVQSNLYYEVTFGTNKKWSYKTGDLLKEVQFIQNFLWEDKKVGV